MGGIWYTEQWSPSTRFAIKVSKQLHSEKTPFQQLDVFESADYGRFFSLDGYIMITQKDEFVYHDMIVHPALATNPAIRNVLVIGGGDGGTVRELLRYKSIDRIDMVELDERVVRVCQQYFPETSSGLTDPRVNLMFADGLKYVSESKTIYDLIIVDSTDPIGPGEGLFSHEFYQNCFRILSDDGILVNQNESPYYEQNRVELKRAYSKIKDLFPIALAYQFHIPTYASGHWLFGFASKKLHPLKDANLAEWKALDLTTKYYNTKVHAGAFALPNNVLAILNEKADA